MSSKTLLCVKDPRSWSKVCADLGVLNLDPLTIIYFLAETLFISKTKLVAHSVFKAHD